ncbi:hypothetical protein [Butyrivibrio proteoclasticus]|uniref:hypothetical protein n=1 Tax=Butyrivibrio proteoclasticus TaxID=43305 RepID=UPI00047D348E|nr:hypothetical protein [Butyrivibrio proteoclasticus]
MTTDISTQTSGSIKYVLYHRHTSEQGSCYTAVQHSGTRTVRSNCTTVRECRFRQSDGTCNASEYYNAQHCDVHDEPYTYYTYTLSCGMSEDDYIRETTDYTDVADNERIFQAIITY